MSCECGKENHEILTLVKQLTSEFRDLRENVVAPMKETLIIVKDKVDRVHKTVHEGNGQPALIARVEALEQIGEKVVLKEDSKTKLNMSKWTFWGAIIVALISSLGAITAAFVK